MRLCHAHKPLFAQSRAATLCVAEADVAAQKSPLKLEGLAVLEDFSLVKRERFASIDAEADRQPVGQVDEGDILDLFTVDAAD